MIKASKEGMKDSGFNYLNMPYLGAARLTSAELAEVNNTEDCLKFTFILKGEDYNGNNVNGFSHEHVEWGNDGSDDDEVIQKKVDRVAYIASVFVPEEKVQSIEANNLKEYFGKVISLLEEEAYSTKDIKIKVLGNVYRDKARVRFPGYNNFIADEESPLTWSKSELQQNQAYLEAVASAPSKASQNGQTVDAAELDEAGF